LGRLHELVTVCLLTFVRQLSKISPLRMLAHPLHMWSDPWAAVVLEWSWLPKGERLKLQLIDLLSKLSSPVLGADYSLCQCGCGTEMYCLRCFCIWTTLNEKFTISFFCWALAAEYCLPVRRRHLSKERSVKNTFTGRCDSNEVAVA
jgi:hypothetical protein